MYSNNLRLSFRRRERGIRHLTYNTLRRGGHLFPHRPHFKGNWPLHKKALENKFSVFHSHFLINEHMPRLNTGLLRAYLWALGSGNRRLDVPSIRTCSHHSPGVENLPTLTTGVFWQKSCFARPRARGRGLVRSYAT